MKGDQRVSARILDGRDRGREINALNIGRLVIGTMSTTLLLAYPGEP